MPDNSPVGRVKRGIALLDRKIGHREWRAIIRQRDINVLYGDDCPLSMAFETRAALHEKAPFYYGLDFVGLLSMKHAADFGFVARSYADAKALNRAWRVLTNGNGAKRETKRPRKATA